MRSHALDLTDSSPAPSWSTTAQLSEAAGYEPGRPDIGLGGQGRASSPTHLVWAELVCGTGIQRVPLADCAYGAPWRRQQRQPGLVHWLGAPVHAAMKQNRI